MQTAIILNISTAILSGCTFGNASWNSSHRKTSVTNSRNQRDGQTDRRLLANNDLDHVTFTGCDDNEVVTIDTSEPERYMIVLIGKGILKLMKSNPNAPASTPVRVISSVEFGKQAP